MRVSELCERSGVPLSTVKFYIREGLLPPGERRGPNQANYGPAHLRRLELIRALRDVCGLGVEAVRRVLSVLPESDPAGGPIRSALRAMEPPAAQRPEAADPGYPETLAEVRAFLDAEPWTLPGDHGEFAESLAAALLHIRRLIAADLPVTLLRPYAQAAWALSEAELAMRPGGQAIAPRPGDELDFPVRMALLGTLLLEPVLLTLRRYALNARGSRRYAGEPNPPVTPIEVPPGL